jgi:hypothetical protein
MIENSIKKSRIFTIVIRIVAFLMMVFGIVLFFSPITNILGYFPLIGGILKGTVGFLIFVGAVIISIPLYIITFSLAWLFYHPKVGIVILGIGVAIITVLIIISSQSKGSTEAVSSSTHHFMWSHI